MNEKPSCEDCLEIYPMQHGGEPSPCETCSKDLMMENVEAFDIYQLVNGQVITAGMGEVVDLNLGTVKMIMELKEVRKPMDCLEKVHRLFHVLLQESKDKGSNG